MKRSILTLTIAASAMMLSPIATNANTWVSVTFGNNGVNMTASAPQPPHTPPPPTHNPAPPKHMAPPPPALPKHHKAPKKHHCHHNHGNNMGAPAPGPAFNPNNHR